MIIQSLEMNNFRQYYGSQSIQFASSEDEQMVTVILGENGRGKTGIYRAMMLAFFGDTKLEQDSREANIILTNIKALEEQPEGVKSEVSILFRHHNQTYRLTRTYFARKETDGVIHEQLFSVNLVNESTGQTYSKEVDIQSVIRKMVDERVKHYFFFDGERIERLTRVSLQQREEIAIGIKNLLKIDSVMKSKEVLNKILIKVKKELEYHSKGEYKKALMELTEKEQIVEEYHKQQEWIRKQRIVNENRINIIDDHLKKYDDLRASFLQREELEKKEEQLNYLLSSKLEQLKTLNKFLPLMLGENSYYAAIAQLQSEIDISSNLGIESSLINRLIEDMRCICGTAVPEHSSAYQQLKVLKESIQTYEDNKNFNDLYQDLRKLLSYLEGRQESIIFILNEIKTIKRDQEEVKWQLEELNNRLRSVQKDEIHALNDERVNLTKAVIKLDFDSKELYKKQEELKKQIEQLELNVQDLKVKSGIRDQLLRKHETLKSSVASLTFLISKFERELMEELEIATQQNLQYLLDDAGLAMMKKVKVNPDYTIEILNAYDQPFLANISQGQRQVLSLSFITALAQVAGGDSFLEMPLLMDTPFGRLSSVHQKGLIEYLPQICSQWILLVTDSEFGKEEQDLFTQSNTIGRSYRLTSSEPGVTIIEENNMPNLVRG